MIIVVNIVYSEIGRAGGVGDHLQLVGFRDLVRKTLRPGVLGLS